MTEGEVVGIIPVRYKSSRFPGKPLADLLGKSLIQRTYENARRARRLDQLIVATDDERIFSHVEGFGGTVYMTSSSCQSGTDRVWEVAQKHCLEARIVVNIQGDEPCLDPEVVDQLVERMVDGVNVATPIAKIVDAQHIFDPGAVKCVFDKTGRALYFSRAPIPFPQNKEKIHDYYRHLGVYCYRRETLEQFAQMPLSRLQEIEDLEQLKLLEAGVSIDVVVVDDQAIGVDTPEDLKKVEQILCANTSS